MSFSAQLDQELILEWINNKRPLTEIEEQLRNRGFEQSMIASYLKEFKRQCNVKRQTRGMLFAAVGAFLGFISCLLTVLNPIPELYEIILYGLTSVAILLILAGLYYIFE